MAEVTGATKVKFAGLRPNTGSENPVWAGLKGAAGGAVKGAAVFFPVLGCGKIAEHLWDDPREDGGAILPDADAQGEVEVQPDVDVISDVFDADHDGIDDKYQEAEAGDADAKDEHDDKVNPDLDATEQIDQYDTDGDGIIDVIDAEVNPEVCQTDCGVNDADITEIDDADGDGLIDILEVETEVEIPAPTVCDNAPAPFNPLFPGNLAKDIPTAPVLMWQASSDADEELLGDKITYRVKVDDDPAFASPEIDAKGIAGVNFQIPSEQALASDTKHYWQVVAGDTCDPANLTETPVYEFTTEHLAGVCDNKPTAFGITEPDLAAIDVAVTPTFVWTPSTDLDANDNVTYCVEIDDDPNFMSPVVSQCGIAGTEFVPPKTLEYFTVYFWRVTAKDKCNQGTKSAPGSFTTVMEPNACDNFPGPFQLVYPGQNAENIPVNSSLSWTESIDPDQMTVANDVITYCLQLAYDKDYKFMVIDECGLTGTKYTPAEGILAKGAHYYWRVFAQDSCVPPQEVKGAEDGEFTTVEPSLCDPDGDGIITDKFKDANLLAAIRDALGKGPEEEILLQDALETTLFIIQDKGIKDLSGMECFTNLTGIHLHYNQISDLTPLSSLANLTWIVLSYNQISDITPLSGLTKLTNLGLFNNQISNLTALSSLTKLVTLNLHNNQISNLTALSGLTNLATLNLGGNFIQDIMALINNSGLGAGDTVTLDCNKIPQLQIDDLKAKGATVNCN